MKYAVNNLYKRKYVLAAIVIITVLIFIAKLFFLQVLSSDYKSSADSNAFFKKTLYPARGRILDRNDKLLIYNQPTYDIIFVPNEVRDLDTLDFCNTLDITLEQFHIKMAQLKDSIRNPGYSNYTLQTFITQLGVKESSLFQEKLYKFPGFFIQNRTKRKYNYPNAGLLFGYVAEIDKKQLNSDDFYRRGDYAGKSGIELSYEKELRGEKGQEILLRDARGRLQGKYENGRFDEEPISGKDLTLSIDIDLQAYAERLLQNKLGSVIMIEPETGEVLCLASSPSYDPSMLLGREYGSNYTILEQNPLKPLYNRAIQGTYPPGSVFKPIQAALFLQEGIITPNTGYPCAHGYIPLGGKPKCLASHESPIRLVRALTVSCNAYFCHGLHDMLHDKKYGDINKAFDVWRKHMKDMAFGVRVGVDLPNENSGWLPDSKFYERIHKTSNWKAHNMISMAIGQGEALATPMQLANFVATVANRGYYYTPHVVKQIDGKNQSTERVQKHDSGIKSEHWESVVEGMAGSVVSGTSRALNTLLAAKGLIVCGKTGTAENPHGDDHSLFIGFAPKDNPKVAIAVVVENGVWGGRYGVPIAKLMFEKFFNDGEILPADKYLETHIINSVVLPPEYRNLAEPVY